MAKVKLSEFAMARSGDKGDGSNVGTGDLRGRRSFEEVPRSTRVAADCSVSARWTTAPPWAPTLAEA